MAVKSKWIMTTIGTIAINCSLNCLFVFNTLSVFLISYFHHFNPSIVLHQSYFLVPLCVFGIYLSNVFSKCIGNSIINTHLKIVLSTFVVELALLVIYFNNTDIYFCYASMFASGLGIGFASLASMTNAVSFSPKKCHKANLIMSSMSNVYSAILTYILIFILNPQYMQPEDRSYFTYAISSKMEIVYLVMLILIPISIAISLPFISQYKHHISKKTFTEEILNIDREEDNSPEMKTQKLIIISSFYRIVNEENKSLSISQKQYRIEIDMIKRSIRLYRILSINFCASFLEYSILNTYITYGSINNTQSIYLYYIPIGLSILSSIGLPLFDFITDKINFQALMISRCLLGIGLGIAFTYAIDYDWAFALVCCLLSIMHAFNLILISRHLIKVYSDRYIPLLLEYMSGSCLISNGLSATLAFMLSHFLIENTKALDYLYYTGSGLNGIGFILTFWEKDEEFSYTI